jgi:hypothetical protein
MTDLLIKTQIDALLYNPFIPRHHRLQQQFGKIMDDNLIVYPELPYTVIKHADAIGTSCGNHLSTSIEGLAYTQHPKALLGKIIVPRTPASPTTAQATFSVVRHLH